MEGSVGKLPGAAGSWKKAWQGVRVVRAQFVSSQGEMAGTNVKQLTSYLGKRQRGAWECGASIEARGAGPRRREAGTGDELGPLEAQLQHL